MRRGVPIRFLLAIVAEVFFFSALNFFDDWTLEQMPIKFVEAAFLSGITYLVAVSNFDTAIATGKQAMLFWIVAIALRLVALPLAPANDLWRYQWEGKLQQAGFNPYATAPDDPKLDEIRQNFPELHKINRRDFQAIYAPGAELLFSSLSRISDRPLFYKLVFAIVDLGAVALLLRLISGETRYAATAWYAWNPLVAYSFAGAAHFDICMILPLIGGIFCIVRSTSESESKPQWIWAVIGALLFGVAISIELPAALLLLPCVFALKRRAIVLALSAAIPVALSSLYGLSKTWNSLGQFTLISRLNDLFWWLIEDTVWPNPHQKNYHYHVIVIICVIAVSLLFIRNWKRGMLWALGTALLLSPVFHPWFCIWILPLATWQRAHAWHVLSVTIFAYYLFYAERLFDLPWHAEPWMRGIIIVPVLAALVMLGARNKSAATST
jgi:alpha-1,6-mannosyltransferase